MNEHYAVVFLALALAVAHLTEAVFAHAVPSTGGLILGMIEIMLVVFATCTAEAARQGDTLKQAIVDFERLSAADEDE